MAERAVLRSFENQTDQDRCFFLSKAHATGQGAQNAELPMKAAKSSRARQQLHNSSAMRRSGRAKAKISYREDSDPIESSSSDEDMDIDQTADRRQPGRQQRTQQQPQLDVVFAAKDKGASYSSAEHSCGDMMDSDEEQNAESDSDFQQPCSAVPAKRQAPGRKAAGKQGARKRRAAATVISSDQDDAAVASEHEMQFVEQSSQDDDEQFQQERDELDTELEEQQQLQKPRHAAAAAAKEEVSGSKPGTRRQRQKLSHQQDAAAPRRSRRVAAAAATDAAEAEPEPVARPRRAAAAAATAANAAALLSEQERLHFSSGSPVSDDASDSDDDLGSRGGSSHDDEALTEGDDSSDDDAICSTGSEDGDEEGSPSTSDGIGRRQHATAATSGRARPRLRRHSAGSNGTRSEGTEQEAGSGSAKREQDDQSEEDGEEHLPDLNAFCFGSEMNAAAAAGSKARRGSGGKCCNSTGGDRSSPAAAGGEQVGKTTGNKRGRRSLSEEALVAEAEAGDICDPAEFEPVELSKLARNNDIEKILSVRYEEDGKMQVLVKLVGKSYRGAVWVPSKQVEAKGRQQLLRNFVTKQASEGPPSAVIDPQWYQVERIVEEWKDKKSHKAQYLVKWAGLEYVDLTWETEEQVTRDGQGRAALARFKRWVKPPAHVPRPPKRPTEALLKQQLLPNFLNGRKLREYQETSLHWMVNNYRGEVRNGRWWPRNCVLGDEMGLGKTAQSISVMAWLRQYGGVTGPFMVVAPLTTLHHWRREIETWTGMNAVLYTGNARDRQLIRETEFYYPSDRTARKALGARFDVLLTSYETVLKDKTELKKIHYEALVLDEAHRLKTRTSSTRAALLELPVRWWLLLSGTPVQNNMRELQGLMSVLDEDAYGDLDDFLERYGDTKPTIQQIRDLQAALAPVLLRRMKEDVENLPEKEEVVIWVELTQEQRRYYRALYSKQIGSLLQGVAAKNLPGMRNLAMELRKLCCHPFLCDGLEDDMAARWAAAHAAGAAAAANQEVEALTRASGKMLLLHKLLTKLRAEGRQVLIFSQFKMMLNLLEDYLAACKYPYERIDGDTNHKQRQAAIDRFMTTKDKKVNSRSTTPADGSEQLGREGSVQGDDGAAQQQQQGPDHVGGPFVFLLSTRAGGQGITLTSADTVIIYDSDWNPQNDLQAMARCHRIGQEREVTVYRLVSQNTYEQQLFECASRKYGLDEAILGFAGSGDNPENDAARIEQLLRLGAHAIAGAGAAAGAAGEQEEEKGMAAEGIDQILAGRSEKRQLGSRKGNTFSIAHFAAAGAEQELLDEEQQETQPVDAKAFWADLLPEAVAAHAAALAAAKEPEILGPRRRTVVNYREKDYARFNSDSEDEDAKDSNRAAKRAEGADDFDASREEGEQDEGLQIYPKKKHRVRPVIEAGASIDPELGRAVQPWITAQLEQAWAAILRWGPDRVDKVIESLNQIGAQRPADEVTQFINSLELLLTELANLPECKPAPKPAATQPAVQGAGATPPLAAAAADTAAAADANKHKKVPNDAAAVRDALTNAGVTGKLPPAVKKALLSTTFLQRVGRCPRTWLSQLQEHQKVHKRMVEAGLAPSTSKAAMDVGNAATATAGTPQKQVIVTAAGTPSTAGRMKSPGKRGRLVPRVSLKGFRHLPAWWSRAHDSRLMLGSYHHGYSHHGGKMTMIIEDILTDPTYGFEAEVALDPLAALIPAVTAAAPQPAAATAGGDQPPSAPSPAAQFSISSQQLAEAKAKKQRMIAAVRNPGSIQWMGPAEWKKFVSTAIARLRKVRQCMLDPTYVEPPKGATPCKANQQPQLQLNRTPASTASAAPGMASAAAEQQQLAVQCAVQQQLAAAKAAAAASAAKCESSAAAAPAARPNFEIKKTTPDSDVVLVSDDADDFRPPNNRRKPDDEAAPAAKKQKLAAAVQGPAASQPANRPSGSKQQDDDARSSDMIDLASQSNTSSRDGTSIMPAAAAKQQSQQAALTAAAPSSGLVLKCVTAEQLSQDKSVEVDEPEAAETGGTPANADKLECNGRQQMQQLLGSSKQAAAASTAAGGSHSTPGQPHPVYGTPASDAAAAAGSKRQASSKGTKGQDAGKQRKIDSFFSSKKR